MKKLFFAFLFSFAAAPASAQYYPGQSLKAHAHTSATDGGAVNNFVAVQTSSAPIMRATNYLWSPDIYVSSKTGSMIASNPFIGHFPEGVHIIGRAAVDNDNRLFSVHENDGDTLLSVAETGNITMGAPPSGKNNLTTVLGLSHFNTLTSTMIVTGRLEITGTAFINGATISTSAVVDASKLPLAGGTMTGPLLTPGITVTGGGQVTAGSFSGDGSALSNLPITSTASIVSTLSGKVEKSGDTMTGALTLSGSSLTVMGAVLVSSNAAIASTIYTKNGNLGVGYNDPTTPLYVRNNTGGNMVFVYTGATADNIGFTADMEGAGGSNIGFNAYVAGATVNKGIQIHADGPGLGANNWAIYSPSQAQSYLAGKIGIGTSVPESHLDIVVGAAAQTTAATIRSGSQSINDNDENSIDFKYYSSAYRSGRISGFIDSNAGGGSGGLKFYTAATSNSAYNATPSMTMKANGNIGIGTASPAYKLEVNGIIQSTGAVISGAPGDNSFACWGTKDGQNRLGYCVTIVGVTCTVCTVP